MKFEEMKKIWNDQNQEHLYVIDEAQLRNTIDEKKRKTSRLVSKMEMFGIMANVSAGGFVLISNFVEQKGYVLANMIGILMLATAGYIYFMRTKRLKSENQFDRTMLGDLEHAINNATYQTRLSFSMLLVFIPIALLVIGNVVEAGKSPFIIFIIVAFMVVVLFLGRWEHRSWHVARKKRLEAMRDKLLEKV